MDNWQPSKSTSLLLKAKASLRRIPLNGSTLYNSIIELFGNLISLDLYYHVVPDMQKGAPLAFEDDENNKVSYSNSLENRVVKNYVI